MLKKYLKKLLVMTIIFSLIGCGETEEPDPNPNGSEYSLEEVAGWWTKPDDFNGVTMLYTFNVNVDSEMVEHCDEYGTILDEYFCYYDEAGLTIEFDDWDSVTYIYDGTNLVDEEGNIQYVRRNPIVSSDAPYTIADLVGNWYKNGNEEASMITIDGNGYSISQMDIETEAGGASVVSHQVEYETTRHAGVIVYLEPHDGLFTKNLWILDNGKVLYDESNNEYYINSSVEASELSTLKNKYTMISENWYSDNNDLLNFKFFGQVWVYYLVDDEYDSYDPVASWTVDQDTLTLMFSDGSTQTFKTTDSSITFDYNDLTFTRWSAW